MPEISSALSMSSSVSGSPIAHLVPTVTLPMTTTLTSFFELVSHRGFEQVVVFGLSLLLVGWVYALVASDSVPAGYGP